MAKYRIIRDAYGGYELQFKRFFIWWQCWGLNTFSSLERAKAAIKLHRKDVVWKE